MRTKEAVEYLISTGLTKYRIAKTLGITPVSINQYLNGTKVSAKTAGLFKSHFSIDISDAFKRD